MSTLAGPDTAAIVQPRVIWILGQSNAGGEDALVTSVTNATGLDAAYPNVRLIQKFATTNGDPLVWTTDTDGDLEPRVDDKFGVELSLGRYLDRVIPRGWAIGKTAVGSSTLFTNWKVSGTYPFSTSPPNLFQIAMAEIAAGLAATGGKLAAIIWIHGEGDSLTATPAGDYETNLTDLIDEIRLTYPSVPFLYNRLIYPGAYASTVQAAQDAVDIAVANTTMIDVSDLTLVGAHFNANSYVTMGNRFALATLAALGIEDPPVASFTAADLGLDVTFTDTSTDGDGTIASWLWDFGDSNTSTSQNPVHTYASAGTYTVTLTVTDDDGNTNTASDSVTVVAITWSIDATSGKGVPVDATEWGDLITANGLTTGVPDHLYLCQDASGDLTDALGGVNITAVGTPLYSQAVSGWSRVGVGWNDAGTARFQRTTTFTAPSAQAYFFLAYSAMTGTPAGNRFVLGVGASVSAAMLALTTGKYRTGSGANTATATNTFGTGVRPLALLADSVNNVTIGADDQETMTPTHTDAGTAGVYVPSSGTTGGGRLVYLAIWRGTKAEAFSRANIKALQEALGWSVAWTP